MKIRYIILCIFWLPFMAGCDDEDSLVPRNSEMTYRFEFPEGDAAWDKDLKEIAEKFQTVPIYKALDSADLARSWVVSSASVRYNAKPLDEELAEFYTGFFKDHIFAFLKPELTQGVLPNYIYLVQDFRQLKPVGGDYSQANYWSGMDFWAFCLKMNPENLSQWTKCFDLPRTPWEYKERRGIILQNIIKKMVEKGKIVMPKEFEEDFDYDGLLYKDTEEDSLSYYKRRGIPGMLTEISFNFAANAGLKKTPILNFTSYIHMGIRYTRDSVPIVFPPEKFPKIIKYYDFTMKYMKDNYDWDVTEMAELPVIKED